MSLRKISISTCVLFLSLTLSCQKNKKAPRPLDVTQKILTDKGGEYQTINGNIVKFGLDRKLTVSKKFISTYLYNQNAPNTVMKGAAVVPPPDIYCQNVLEFDINQIKELSAKNLSDAFPTYSYRLSPFLDPDKPVYIFDGTMSSQKSLLYEDIGFSVDSKADASKLKSCANDDSEFNTISLPFFAQYDDENTLLFLSAFFSDEYNKFESPTRYYKTLEAPAYSSAQFMSKFPSLNHLGATATLDNSSRTAEVSYVKETMGLSIEVSDTSQYSVPNDPLCSYRLQIDSTTMYKMNMMTFPLMFLRNRFFTSSATSYFNFIEPKQVRIEFAKSGTATAKCQSELAELKKIENLNGDYLFGFQTNNGQASFFIYSVKTLEQTLQATFYTIYETKK